MIVLLDVLEHLDNDVNSLRVLNERLNPGGWLLITVPACPSLWSKSDEKNHHRRRYTRRGLVEIVNNTGYTVYYNTYFNFFLFPLIGGLRMIQRMLRSDADELTMPPKWINCVLTTVFSSERHLIGRINFPIGVSLLVLAQKAPYPTS